MTTPPREADYLRHLEDEAAKAWERQREDAFTQRDLEAAVNVISKNRTFLDNLNAAVSSASRKA